MSSKLYVIGVAVDKQGYFIYQVLQIYEEHLV